MSFQRTNNDKSEHLNDQTAFRYVFTLRLYVPIHVVDCTIVHFLKHRMLATNCYLVTLLIRIPLVINTIISVNLSCITVLI